MNILMYIVALAAIAFVVYALVKKMDIKIVLFATGIVLMFIAMLMGRGISIPEFEGTGFALFDPLLAIATEFTDTLTGAGFLILVLGGYTSYMSKIGANDETVNALMKPVSFFKSPYALVPLVFLLGHLMSIVIPSASNLAIILLATLFPVLKAAGMTTLTIAGVIATTATIMPTPLGSDNVAIAAELSQVAEFAGLTVTEYVLQYHAPVSITVILLMAVVHYFWQRYRDKKDLSDSDLEVSVDEDQAETKKASDSMGFRIIYGLLPVLPILILIFAFFMNTYTNMNITIGVEVVTFFSLIIAILIEMLHSRDVQGTLKDTDTFFNGMGNSIGVVALIAAASVFVLGLQSIGIIETLENFMLNVNVSGFVLPLILVLITVVIVLITGSGTALTFAMIPLMVPLANAAGINPVALTVPVGLAGNLMRAASPVAAVVMITAGTLDQEPIEVVKRTSVPMVVGLIVMFGLSMLLYV